MSSSTTKTIAVVEPIDVAALAVHIMTNTALTGATYEIDGGSSLSIARGLRVQGWMRRPRTELVLQPVDRLWSCVYGYCPLLKDRVNFEWQDDAGTRSNVQKPDISAGEQQIDLQYI